MDPAATVFVPVHALNAPPRPRFERYYDEFKVGVAKMQDLATIITEDEGGDLHDHADEWTQFKQVNIRLLKIGKFLTAHIGQAFAAGEFDQGDHWFGSALNECMILCLKYSWATTLLIQHRERQMYGGLALQLAGTSLKRKSDV